MGGNKAGGGAKERLKWVPQLQNSRGADIRGVLLVRCRELHVEREKFLDGIWVICSGREVKEGKRRWLRSRR